MRYTMSDVAVTKARNLSSVARKVPAALCNSASARRSASLDAPTRRPIVQHEAGELGVPLHDGEHVSLVFKGRMRFRPVVRGPHEGEERSRNSNVVSPTTRVTDLAPAPPAAERRT